MLFVVGATIYMAFNGRDILLSQIEKNTGLKVQIASLKVLLPDTIVAEDIKLSDSISIGRMEVTPSLIGLLSRQVVFNKLVIDSPEMTVTRKEDDSFDLGLVLPKQSGNKNKAVFYVNKLLISNGTVNFVDKGLVGQEPFVLKCSQIKADIHRPSVLQLFRMNFNVSGRLLGKDDSDVGQVVLNGWVDPINMDMESKLEAKNGRLLYFAPYYEKFFSKDLKSGDAALTVNAVSKKNDMTADCHIALTNVAFLEPEGEETQENQKVDLGNLAFMTFDSLLGPDGNLNVDFSVRTKMNNPKFENVKLKGTFFANRIEATFSKPPQQTIEDFKKVGEQFEAIGKQFKKIFKGD